MLILLIIIIIKIILCYKKGINEKYMKNGTLSFFYKSFLKNGSFIISFFDSFGLPFDLVEPILLIHFLLLTEHPDKIKYMSVNTFEQLFLTQPTIRIILLLLFSKESNHTIEKKEKRINEESFIITDGNENNEQGKMNKIFKIIVLILKIFIEYVECLLLCALLLYLSIIQIAEVFTGYRRLKNDLTIGVCF